MRTRDLHPRDHTAFGESSTCRLQVGRGSRGTGDPTRPGRVKSRSLPASPKGPLPPLQREQSLSGHRGCLRLGFVLLSIPISQHRIRRLPAFQGFADAHSPDHSDTCRGPAEPRCTATRRRSSKRSEVSGLGPGSGERRPPETTVRCQTGHCGNGQRGLTGALTIF